MQGVAASRFSMQNLADASDAGPKPEKSNLSWYVKQAEKGIAAGKPLETYRMVLNTKDTEEWTFVSKHPEDTTDLEILPMTIAYTGQRWKATDDMKAASHDFNVLIDGTPALSVRYRDTSLTSFGPIDVGSHFFHKFGIFLADPKSQKKKDAAYTVSMNPTDESQLSGRREWCIERGYCKKTFWNKCRDSTVYVPRKMRDQDKRYWRCMECYPVNPVFVEMGGMKFLDDPQPPGTDFECKWNYFSKYSPLGESDLIEEGLSPMDARFRYSSGVVEVVRHLNVGERLKGGGADEEEASVMMIVATAIKPCFEMGCEGPPPKLR